MHRITKLLPLIIVLLSPLIACVSLFHPGFFSMHDDQQIARLYELTKILHEGQFPPRWVPDLGYGYGYPLFIFYPPLVYYLGFIVHSLGFGLIDSTKIVMGLGFILPSLFMYLWIRNRAGEASGVIAALLYTFFQYHGTDLYVRGAFAEYFSFVWIPAVFWTFDRISQKRTLGWIMGGGVTLALVVLTHDLIAMQFLPFLALYILFLIWEQRNDWKSVTPLFVYAGLIGLGLSCFFWLPSLLEKQYTLVDAILTKELASYQLHFVCIKQLWNSPWGYGGSVPDCNDGLSFEIGKEYIIGLLVAVAIGIVAYIKRKRSSFFVFLISNTLLAIFLTVKYSLFIWKLIPPFAYIQFPWRFLLFVGIFISASIGFSLSFFTGKLRKVAIGISCIIIGVAIIFSLQHFIPYQFLSKTDVDYTTKEDISWRISGTSFEYVPKEVTTTKSNINTTQLAITHDDLPSTPASLLNVSGNAKLELVQNLSWKKEFITHTDGNTVLRINTYAFPGWVVTMDGKEMSYTAHNTLHVIEVTVPSGVHTFILTFIETSVRKIADLVTLVTGIAILGSIFVIYRYKKQ